MGTFCQAAETEADLLAKLKSNDTSFRDKTAACKRLAVVGTEKTVPVLAGLLDDDKLSHYARYGLEPIPSDEVDKVLLAALETVQGRHLIGVIQSLGNRGKASAIEAIAKKLDDADREVAKAAAHCLGRLGTTAASGILSKRMSGEFAPAGLVCAKQLARQGQADAAIALLLKVFRQEDAAEYVRLAAMLHTTKLQGDKGTKLLAEALSSDDKSLLNMGLRTARLIDPVAASRVASEVLKSSKPAKAALLITLLGDLGQATSLATVVGVAQSSDEQSRVAALEAIASLGGADQVALLLDAAADKSETVAATAMETLVALPGDDIDRVVLEMVKDEQRKDTAIQVVGRRRITAAVPMLVKMLENSGDVDLILALGETVSLDDLDLLGKRLGNESAEIREAAGKALHAACYRMTDRAATVAKLVSYFDGASEETTRVVMDELRHVGGSEALAAVAASASGDDELRRDFSTQALGQWLDTSAAAVLLKLAQDEGETKYGIRGIRGYIRLARQFSMPAGERVKMCRTALKTAKRTEDKMLVLKVLERYPSVGTLKVAVEAAADAELQKAASATAKTVGRKVKGHRPAVKALLAKLPKS
ncbi:MAG: hypothetical protein GXP26_08680 [Planctomycetes bacterium]|nr:hypothetical protein [Planctomycetota bacterium]